MTDRTDVLALVGARVRFRFALSAEQFSDRVMALARDAGRDVGSYVRLLSLDDLYLASACARRDEQAWAECARLHFGFMRQFAHRFLPSADATELTDHVIADLWEKGKLERYQGRSSLRTWLGAVVAHAALQAGKVARRRHANAAEARDNARTRPAMVSAPEDEQAARLLAGITSEAVSALPDDQKVLLLLHYEQNLSLDEIAPILNASKATLSRRLKRLREGVRATIERLARDRYRSTGEGVRGRVDLARIEMDLSALLGDLGPVEGNGEEGV